VVYDAEGESAMATSQDQREGELQVSHCILFIGISVAYSDHNKRLLRLSSWVPFSLGTHVKRVCQRSVESGGFSPSALVSSHRES
jgi:hypothetical protein